MTVECSWGKRFYTRLYSPGSWSSSGITPASSSPLVHNPPPFLPLPRAPGTAPYVVTRSVIALCLRVWRQQPSRRPVTSPGSLGSGEDPGGRNFYFPTTAVPPGSQKSGCPMLPSWGSFAAATPGISPLRESVSWVALLAYPDPNPIPQTSPGMGEAPGKHVLHTCPPTSGPPESQQSKQQAAKGTGSRGVAASSFPKDPALGCLPLRFGNRAPGEPSGWRPLRALGGPGPHGPSSMPAPVGGQSALLIWASPASIPGATVTPSCFPGPTSEPSHQPCAPGLLGLGPGLTATKLRHVCLVRRLSLTLR